MSRARSEQARTDEDMLGDDDPINQERNRPWLPGSTGSRSTESSGEVEFVTASEDAQSPIMIPSDPDFGLKPPKLDGYMQRRDKDMGVLKAVNTTEDVLIMAQLKIMDVAPPLVDLYARLSAPGGGETEELMQVKSLWKRLYGSGDELSCTEIC
ncbi:hypothetical protein OUZ56_003203 [Daphnia magna]|uniref:Intraflagellar transport protein 46 homolog n=1 Tax=Daphnia magna TaxID=35525 RepID=A0ABR0A8C0_9CRUS|nr:hypothetical protein OUZ56_003203 [Daphnia magna]